LMVVRKKVRKSMTCLFKTFAKGNW
jgi:hypothetical protein